MHLFVRTLLWLDWIIALGWLWRVLVWRGNLHRVPNLRSGGHKQSAGYLPSLSVIVPARNEEVAIAASLSSLLAAKGVCVQVIAVNDRSTDRTGALMEEVKARYEGPSTVSLEVLHIADLPEGWLGKTHAMAMAARQAKGNWLLFTDGDVLFDPDALRLALGFALTSDAAHLVVLPTVLMRTPGERLMISFLHVLSLLVVRPWLVPDPRAKRDAIGVGAFNLLRRDVYDALGGWEALRFEVVEDLALGRRVKAQGFAQRVATGVDLVKVRWAVGAFGVVENTTKNLFAMCRFRVEWLLAAACGLVMISLFPLAMSVIGRAAWWPLGVLLLALFLAYQGAGKFQHFTAAQMPLYPVASGLFVYAMLRSMSLALGRGGIQWRGTFYALSALRKAQRGQ